MLRENSMAEEQDKGVGEMLAEAINMAFERHSNPNRIQILSGRRKRFRLNSKEGRGGDHQADEPGGLGADYVPFLFFRTSECRGGIYPL
jgi:hypothetical protein